MKLNIDIEPMGAVRMTGRGKWVKPNAQKYLSYKTEIALKAKVQAKLEMPIQAPILIRQITFIMPIPKDGRITFIDNGKRRTRKVEPGEYHTFKPDIDNLFKGVTDSLNGILWTDDSHICEIGRQLKIYGNQPGIEIEFDALRDGIRQVTVEETAT